MNILMNKIIIIKIIRLIIKITEIIIITFKYLIDYKK